MNPVASLEDLMAYMETSLEIEGFRAYFDRRTARIVAIEKWAMKAAKNGREKPIGGVDNWKEEVETAQEIINDKTGRFIQPPDKSSFDEDRCKAQFVNTVRDPRIAKKLALTLTEKDKFHIFPASFASVLYRFGLEEQWYKYLADAMKQFVIKWAKENNLPYEDDLKAGT